MKKCRLLSKTAKTQILITSLRLFVAKVLFFFVLQFDFIKRWRSSRFLPFSYSIFLMVLTRLTDEGTDSKTTLKAVAFFRAFGRQAALVSSENCWRGKGKTKYKTFAAQWIAPASIVKGCRFSCYPLSRESSRCQRGHRARFVRLRSGGGVCLHKRKSRTIMARLFKKLVFGFSDGSHLFRLQILKIRTRNEAIRMMAAMAKRFPFPPSRE